MPIQRHPALAPLSREHHHALLLARGLQKGASVHIRATLPQDASALAAHVCTFFDERLAPHFALEEELLMPAARGRTAPLDAACADVIDEHARLRAMIEELRTPTTAAVRLESVFDAFGALLESHVRSEERVLYTGMQDTLDEAELRAVGAAIVARELHGAT